VTPPEADLPCAVLDACVLYPAGLRNLFMWLAVEGIYVPKWTDAIHREWIDNALEEDARRHAPPRLDRAKLERTRALMDENAPRSRVTGYEHRIAGLALPDPDDRHVLAAAIEAGASVIVTFNDRHFPDAALAAYGIAAVGPDAFLCERFDAEPHAFLRAVSALRESLKNPPLTLEQLCQGWQRVGLTRLVRRITAHASLSPPPAAPPGG
jgi:hypothetical protein